MRSCLLVPSLLVALVPACAPSIPRADAGRRPDTGPVVALNDSRCGDGTCQPTEIAECALDCHCGDGLCDPRDETTADCEVDCPRLTACGDGVCDRLSGETAYLCPRDCEAICSDGFCEESAGETPSSCAIDCGCGDGTCDPAFESATRCPADCAPECGDAYCDPRGEDVGSCADDCWCGNGVCDDGETDAACPADCYSLSCGDGTCGSDEDYDGCPRDCEYVSSCGDGACDDSEDSESCEADCPIEAGCGDGVCAADELEVTCPEDCLIGPSCGDGTCSGVETAESCGVDCAPPGTCGDTVCDVGTETVADCAADCFLADCGDTVCDPAAFETEASCPEDCLPPSCGDGFCDEESETESSCSFDCSSEPACGDGACADGESRIGCPEDCPFCGDGVCSSAETSASCDLDCGIHAPVGGPRPLGAGTRDVILYAPQGYNRLADALRAAPAPGVTYWITVPVSGDKTRVPPLPPGLRGGNIRAVAEFNFAANGGGTPRSTMVNWNRIGRQYHTTLQGMGYDAWAINETNMATPGRGSEPGVNARAAMIALIRGLYEGNPGDRPMQGILYLVNRPHGGAANYRPQLESWLQNTEFWSVVREGVQFVAQESYVDPRYVCHSGPANREARARGIQQFAMHIPRLVHAPNAPPEISGLRDYLDGHYVPLLNSFFGSPGLYGHTCGTGSDRCVDLCLLSGPAREYSLCTCPADQPRCLRDDRCPGPRCSRGDGADVERDMMFRMVSEQTRAARLWHPGSYLPGRIGFAFGVRMPTPAPVRPDPPTDAWRAARAAWNTQRDAALRELADHLARNLQASFGGRGACSVDVNGESACRFGHGCSVVSSPTHWSDYSSWCPLASGTPVRCASSR